MCLAVPGEILDIQGEDPIERRGRVDFGGVARVVSLALLPEAHPGDYVLVHAGVALSVLDQEEAQSILDAIAELDEQSTG